MLRNVLLPQVLALTFDDGPQASSLLAVLDVLKAHAVPATFFVNTYTASDWLGPFSSPANQVTQPLTINPRNPAALAAAAPDAWPVSGAEGLLTLSAIDAQLVQAHSTKRQRLHTSAHSMGRCLAQVAASWCAAAVC